MIGALARRAWVLWIAIALLAAADSVGVALVAVDTAPAPSSLLARDATTTLSPLDATPSSTTPALPVLETSTTSAGASPTTASRTATTRASTTAPPPSGVVVPKAGTYHYHVTSSSKLGADPPEEDAYDEDLNVVDLGGGRQRHRTLSDGELDNVDEILWRADGRYVAVSMDADQPSPDDCNWEPDMRTLALPANPGTTWTFKSSCTLKDPDTSEQYTLSFGGNARITGTDRTSVGGATVDVVRIHFDLTAGDDGAGDAFTIDELYAPSYALTVEETQRSSGTEEDDNGNQVAYSDVETRRIQSVSPT